MTSEDLDKTRREDPEKEPSTGSFIFSSQIRGDVERFLFSESHPESVGAYHLLEVLGEGGMGVVYLAEQTEPIRRRVAIKLIKGGADSREVISRFESERQTLALMSHPNIAQVYDAGSTPAGLPYFVMEYIENGVPLTAFADERRLTVRERLRLFVRVCDALQHAHQKGVIHRDIKPSNILVASQNGTGTPKIIDFGISKALDARSVQESFYTETGNIIGTPGYMSPEQTDVGSIDIDTRTDIYSLGALLYELLVGSLPLDSETLRKGNLVDILLKIREENPLRPSTRLKLRQEKEQATRAAERRRTHLRGLEKRLSGDLDWITMKALEKEPARRYASASEFAADLERHSRHEPVLAGPPSFAYRARKFAERYRWRLVIASIGAILLLGFVVGNWSFSHWVSRNRLLVDGKAHLRKFEESRGQKDQFFRDWRDERKRSKTWQPPWERLAELEAYETFREFDARLKDHFSQAALKGYQALQQAPLFSSAREEARRHLEKVHFAAYEQAIADGQFGLSPEYFKQVIETLGIGTYAEALEGLGTLRLTTSPAGAEVFCFRYENAETDPGVEEHSVPLPVDTASGQVIGSPFLRVFRTRGGHETFRVGDRLRTFRTGRKALLIRTRRDLARLLLRVKPDEEVEVRVRRGEKVISLEWIPFPAEKQRGLLQAGRLLDVYRQLDVCFEGYPLHPTARCSAGRTVAGSPLEIELPAGSYLFLLRESGKPDVRLPWRVRPAQSENVSVRRVDAARIPPGFVYVPAGSFSYGGDPDSYRGLDRGEIRVDGFFIARTEVTFRDYLEFLNDPETRRRLGTGIDVEPIVDFAAQGIEARKKNSSRRVQLVPVVGKIELVKLIDERYQLSGAVARMSLDGPALGVPVLAALEYAHWIGKKHGGRWRFRLPSDFEWERAARGVDRRAHVWGNYPMYSFLNSRLSNYPDPELGKVDRIARVMEHPMDESVFGVFDMAGLAKEPVLSPGVSPELIPVEEAGWATLRGASWDSTDERDFRIATRNRRMAHYSIRFVGIRLVAEMD